MTMTSPSEEENAKLLRALDSKDVAMIALLRREAATTRKLTFIAHKALVEKFEQHRTAIAAQKQAFDAQMQFQRVAKIDRNAIPDSLRTHLDSITLQNTLLTERTSALEVDLSKMTKCAADNLATMLQSQRRVDPQLITAARQFSRQIKGTRTTWTKLRDVAAANFVQMQHELRTLPSIMKRGFDSWEQAIRQSAGKQLCTTDQERLNIIEEKADSLLSFLSSQKELFAGAATLSQTLAEFRGVLAPSRSDIQKRVELRVGNLTSVLRAFTSLDVALKTALGEPDTYVTQGPLPSVSEVKVFDELRHQLAEKQAEAAELRQQIRLEGERCRQEVSAGFEMTQNTQHKQIESLKNMVLQLQRQLAEAQKQLSLKITPVAPPPTAQTSASSSPATVHVDGHQALPARVDVPIALDRVGGEPRFSLLQLESSERLNLVLAQSEARTQLEAVFTSSAVESLLRKALLATFRVDGTAGSEAAKTDAATQHEEAATPPPPPDERTAPAKNEPARPKPKKGTAKPVPVDNALQLERDALRDQLAAAQKEIEALTAAAAADKLTADTSEKALQTDAVVVTAVDATAPTFTETSAQCTVESTEAHTITERLTASIGIMHRVDAGDIAVQTREDPRLREMRDRVEALVRQKVEAESEWQDEKDGLIVQVANIQALLDRSEAALMALRQHTRQPEMEARPSVDVATQTTKTTAKQEDAQRVQLDTGMATATVNSYSQTEPTATHVSSMQTDEQTMERPVDTLAPPQVADDAPKATLPRSRFVSRASSAAHIQTQEATIQVLLEPASVTPEPREVVRRSSDAVQTDPSATVAVSNFAAQTDLTLSSFDTVLRTAHALVLQHTETQTDVPLSDVANGGERDVLENHTAAVSVQTESAVLSELRTSETQTAVPLPLQTVVDRCVEDACTQSVVTSHREMGSQTTAQSIKETTAVPTSSTSTTGRGLTKRGSFGHVSFGVQVALQHATQDTQTPVETSPRSAADVVTHDDFAIQCSLQNVTCDHDTQVAAAPLSHTFTQTDVAVRAVPQHVVPNVELPAPASVPANDQSELSAPEHAVLKLQAAKPHGQQTAVDTQTDAPALCVTVAMQTEEAMRRLSSDAAAPAVVATTATTALTDLPPFHRTPPPPRATARLVSRASSAVHTHTNEATVQVVFDTLPLAAREPFALGDDEEKGEKPAGITFTSAVVTASIAVQTDFNVAPLHLAAPTSVNPMPVAAVPATCSTLDASAQTDALMPLQPTSGIVSSDEPMPIPTAAAVVAQGHQETQTTPRAVLQAFGVQTEFAAVASRCNETQTAVPMPPPQLNSTERFVDDAGVQSVTPQQRDGGYQTVTHAVLEAASQTGATALLRTSDTVSPSPALTLVSIAVQAAAPVLVSEDTQTPVEITAPRSTDVMTTQEDAAVQCRVFPSVECAAQVTMLPAPRAPTPSQGSSVEATHPQQTINAEPELLRVPPQAHDAATQTQPEPKEMIVEKVFSTAESQYVWDRCEFAAQSAEVPTCDAEISALVAAFALSTQTTPVPDITAELKNQLANDSIRIVNLTDQVADLQRNNRTLKDESQRIMSAHAEIVQLLKRLDTAEAQAAEMRARVNAASSVFTDCNTMVLELSATGKTLAIEVASSFGQVVKTLTTQIKSSFVANRKLNSDLDELRQCLALREKTIVALNAEVLDLNATQRDLTARCRSVSALLEQTTREFEVHKQVTQNLSADTEKNYQMELARLTHELQASQQRHREAVEAATASDARYAVSQTRLIALEVLHSQRVDAGAVAAAQVSQATAELIRQVTSLKSQLSSACATLRVHRLPVPPGVDDTTADTAAMELTEVKARLDVEVEKNTRQSAWAEEKVLASTKELDVLTHELRRLNGDLDGLPVEAEPYKTFSRASLIAAILDASESNAMKEVMLRCAAAETAAPAHPIAALPVAPASEQRVSHIHLVARALRVEDEGTASGFVDSMHFRKRGLPVHTDLVRPSFDASKLEGITKARSAFVTVATCCIVALSPEHEEFEKDLNELFSVSERFIDAGWQACSDVHRASVMAVLYQVCANNQTAWHPDWCASALIAAAFTFVCQRGASDNELQRIFTETDECLCARQAILRRAWQGLGDALPVEWMKNASTLLNAADGKFTAGNAEEAVAQVVSFLTGHAVWLPHQRFRQQIKCSTADHMQLEGRTAGEVLLDVLKLKSVLELYDRVSSVLPQYLRDRTLANTALFSSEARRTAFEASITSEVTPSMPTRGTSIRDFVRFIQGVTTRHASCQTTKTEPTLPPVGPVALEPLSSPSRSSFADVLMAERKRAELLALQCVELRRQLEVTDPPVVHVAPIKKITARSRSPLPALKHNPTEQRGVFEGMANTPPPPKSTLPLAAPSAGHRRRQGIDEAIFTGPRLTTLPPGQQVAFPAKVQQQQPPPPSKWQQFM